MQPGSNFSASEWIVEKITGAQNLLPETLKAVENFTLMWNLFEDLLCPNNNANIPALERLSSQIPNIEKNKQAIAPVFTYYKDRYCSGSGFNTLFVGLNFRSGNRREHVERALRSDGHDFQSTIFAVMIILYRIRNNLFHGLKSIDTLNDQATNLNFAAFALTTIFEMHGGFARNGRS